MVALRDLLKQIGNLPSLFRKSKTESVSSGIRLCYIVTKCNGEDNGILLLQLVWVVTFLAVLILGIIYGLAVGVVFALLTMVVKSSWYDWDILPRAIHSFPTHNVVIPYLQAKKFSCTKNGL